MTKTRGKRNLTRDGRRVLLGLAALLQGCAFLPPLPAPDLDAYAASPDEAPGAWKIEQIDSRQIRESSGLVKSRTHPNVFWTHNDSGGEPRIFAITRHGEVLAEYEIPNAEALDWEDIAIDDSGHLYLGDIGNNLNRRKDLTIYRVPEPEPSRGGGSAPSDRKFRFRYAEQKKLPGHLSSNFDAEALFWMQDDLYVLTKHRSDLETALLRIPGSTDEEEIAVAPIARLDLSGGRRTILGTRARDVLYDPFGNVTGADLSPDGRLLAILTYRAIFLYEHNPEAAETSGPFTPLHRIDLRSRRVGQVESIAWDDDSLIFGNERGALFRIPQEALDSLERYPP